MTNGVGPTTVRAAPPGWRATAVWMTVVLACACTPSSAGGPAASGPVAADTARQQLQTIDHLVPRPNSVGAQPARIA